MKKFLIPLAVLTIFASSLTAFAQTTGGDGGGNTGGGGNLLLQLQDALEQTPESTTAEPEPTEPSGGGTLITPEPISAPAPTPAPTPTPVVAPATLPSVGIQDNQLLYAVSFAVFLISTLAILNRERFAKGYRKASNVRN